MCWEYRDAPIGAVEAGYQPLVERFNARRFETPLEAFPKLVRIDAALRGIEAFAKAAPEAVKPE